MKQQILVVDDSLTIRMNLRSALGAAGFRVTACESKALAEKLLETRAYSLVILDVLLGDGDGIDLLKQIRSNQRFKHLPVILLSTEAEVKDRILGMTVGADEYVGKPYDIGYLITRARELMNRRDATNDATPDSGRPGKILAVDDSPSYLRALARVLREDGHDIILASSGEEALTLLGVERVDCVIMDLLMPGMGGMEAARRIRDNDATRFLPIMILTGWAEGQSRSLGARIGVDEFAIKSSDMESVKAQLRSLLQRARRAKHARESGDAFPAAGEQAPPSMSSSALLDAVVAASGLPTVIAPNAIRRALGRAGVQPASMTRDDLHRALPAIAETLQSFLGGEDLSRRLEAITALATRSAGQSRPS